MSDGDLRDFFGDAFDPASVEPSEDFVALPPGKYPVEVESAEVKETKAGNGHYIKVALRVLEDPGKNRKLWDNINIDNPSEKCVEIGMRQLSALCQAVGLVAIRDTAELKDKTCIAHVKVDGENNSIRTYSSAAIQQQVLLPKPDSPCALNPRPEREPTEQIARQQPVRQTMQQPVQQVPLAQSQPVKPPWVR